MDEMLDCWCPFEMRGSLHTRVRRLYIYSFEDLHTFEAQRVLYLSAVWPVASVFDQLCLMHWNECRTDWRRGNVLVSRSSYSRSRQTR